MIVVVVGGFESFTRFTVIGFFGYTRVGFMTEQLFPPRRPAMEPHTFKCVMLAGLL